MGKLLKILAVVLGLIVVLVVAAIIIIPLVVNPNDFKDEITAEVKKATGRELLIRGDLGLSVFPWLGLELNGLDLSNAPGFGDQPFVAVQHAQIRVKLMPLLRKTLEVDTVRVEGLQLNLAKAQDGRTNWQDLAGAGKAETAPGRQPAAAGAGIEGLAIGGIEVADARVVWDDRAAGARYEIDKFALTSGAIRPGRPVDLKMAFVVDSARPLLKARVALDARLETDASLQNISLAPLHLDLDDLQAEGLSGQVRLESRVAADLASQRYALDDLRVSLSAHGKGLPEQGVNAELLAAVVADLGAETLALRDLKLSSGDLVVSGGLQGEKIQTAPSFTGDLEVAAFSLRDWMQQLGLPVPETADPGVFRRVALAMHMNSSPKRVGIEKLAVTLDDTHLTGDLRLEPPAKPGIRFALAVDAIDLDRYLPPPGEAGPASQEKKTAPAGAGAESPALQLFPVETLRQLDIDGVFRVGRMTIKKLVAQDIELNLKAKNGRVTLGEKVKTFYQGNIKGAVGLDVTGSEPRLKINQHIAGIQAGPLLQDLTGKDSVTGTGGFNASLAAAGQSPDALTRTLGGKLDFRFTDGAVKGINLAKMLRDAKARFKGKPIPPGNEPEQTDFSELSGSANITRGVLVNRDLRAKSPLFRVEGAGKVDLVAQSLDYILTPVIVGTLQGQGGKGLEDLKGIEVPVRLTGPLTKPEYKIDWKQVLLASQKSRLREQTDKLEKKLEDKLQDKVPAPLKDTLHNKLKGLFQSR